MMQRAIANASAHDINIHAGNVTAGDGNCIFTSVLDNLNTRVSFQECYDGTADEWRRIWMTEVENEAFEIENDMFGCEFYHKTKN